MEYPPKAELFLPLESIFASDVFSFYTYATILNLKAKLQLIPYVSLQSGCLHILNARQQTVDLILRLRKRVENGHEKLNYGDLGEQK